MNWTPFSEHKPWMNTGVLPPKAGRVLLTVKRANGKLVVEQAYYKGCWGRGSYVFSKTSGEIIAWAPVPEPYTGPTREQIGCEASDFELDMY